MLSSTRRFVSAKSHSFTLPAGRFCTSIPDPVVIAGHPVSFSFSFLISQHPFISTKVSILPRPSDALARPQVIIGVLTKRIADLSFTLLKYQICPISSASNRKKFRECGNQQFLRLLAARKDEENTLLWN